MRKLRAMDHEKYLTIHFINGTKMDVSFPTQIKNSSSGVAEAAKRILESGKLVIQADEKTIIIPWSSVKYVEAAGVPASALPFEAIKGAQISESAETI